MKTWSRCTLAPVTHQEARGGAKETPLEKAVKGATKAIATGTGTRANVTSRKFEILVTQKGAAEPAGGNAKVFGKQIALRNASKERK